MQEGSEIRIGGKWHFFVALVAELSERVTLSNQRDAFMNLFPRHSETLPLLFTPVAAALTLKTRATLYSSLTSSGSHHIL